MRWGLEFERPRCVAKKERDGGQPIRVLERDDHLKLQCLKHRTPSQVNTSHDIGTPESTPRVYVNNILRGLLAGGTAGC